MPFALGPTASKSARLVAFESIASTNSYAVEQARAGLRGPLWVVARQQSAGYGRRGRAWHHPEGNLAASVLLTTAAPLAAAATLGFAAALAVEQALAGLLTAGGASIRRLSLKWPNDVLLDGRKVAGILLESEQVAPDRLAVVVGIGINVSAAPAGLPYPATSLREAGVSAETETVFAALTDAWSELVALWDEGKGTADIRARWLLRAAGIGEPVAVQLGSRVVRGTFETLDADGRMLLRAADHSVVVISAGEVHFGAVATLHPARPVA